MYTSLSSNNFTTWTPHTRGVPWTPLGPLPGSFRMARPSLGTHGGSVKKHPLQRFSPRPQEMEEKNKYRQQTQKVLG